MDIFSTFFAKGFIKKCKIEKIKFNLVENPVLNFEKKTTLLVIFLAVLASCEYTPQTADNQTIMRFINETVADTEICLKDKEFHFPDVIVGPKYSGKGLVQLDALVSAGLLRETEKVVSEPNSGPKYIYHYKQNHLIERKTFYLTDQGLKYYRLDQQGAGYFCYGRPDKVRIIEVNLAKNAQNDLVLTATFSYDVAINPDATWISNPWIQRKFPQTSPGQNRQTAQQHFIKDSQDSIKPVSSGILDSHYW